MNRRTLALFHYGLSLLFVVLAPGRGINAQVIREVNQPKKHLRRQDDLDAVGQRKIGSKGLGNWYSSEQEVDFGLDCSRQLEQDAKLITDPVVNEYINRIGQNLVRNSDAKVRFTIKVIESDEINAYAIAGGYLYVNTSLIMAAEGEAELAAVMAHEIAHVAAHHAARQLTRAKMLSLVGLPFIFVGGPFGIAIEEATKLVAPIAETRFSRHLEREADYLGVEYMYLTGYDPQAFISFFERLRVLERQKPGTVSRIFAVHPQTADRIRKTQSEIARILPARDLYITNTSEFESIKVRLAELSSWHVSQQGLADRPTLRHRGDVEHVGTHATDRMPTVEPEDVE